MNGTTPAGRRVQERARLTRLRLLDAAVYCLATYGYSETTTARIQAEAGVSRGSLLHQFPSKDELLVAAVQHLAEARTTELAASSVESDASRNSVDHAVDVLWATMQGQLFAATTELWIASRTNSDLRQVLQPEERRLGRVIRDAIAAMFGPDLASAPQFTELRSLLLSSMRGVALTYSFDPRDSREDPHVLIWKRLAHLYLDR